MDDGYEAALRLLARASEITAVFAANDQLAIGAMAVAEHAGRAVPSALSVVGTGNVLVLPFLRPALTTVAVPTFVLGQIGARPVLERRARRAGRAVDDRVLPVELVTRGSVARPMEGHGQVMNTPQG